MDAVTVIGIIASLIVFPTIVWKVRSTSSATEVVGKIVGITCLMAGLLMFYLLVLDLPLWILPMAFGSVAVCWAMGRRINRRSKGRDPGR